MPTQLSPPQPIYLPQGIARCHVRSAYQHRPDGVLGPADLVQPLLPRFGEGLGHNARQVIVHHGGLVNLSICRRHTNFLASRDWSGDTMRLLIMTTVSVVGMAMPAWADAGENFHNCGVASTLSEYDKVIRLYSRAIES